jgi:hypothetical protein
MTEALARLFRAPVPDGAGSWTASVTVTPRIKERFCAAREPYRKTPGVCPRLLQPQ